MSFLTPTESLHTTNSDMAVKKEALRVLPQPFAHFRSTVVSSTINTKATTSGSKTKEEKNKRLRSHHPRRDHETLFTSFHGESRKKPRRQRPEVVVEHNDL